MKTEALSVTLTRDELLTLVALLGGAHELPWQTKEEFDEITTLYRRLYRIAYPGVLREGEGPSEDSDDRLLSGRPELLRAKEVTVKHPIVCKACLIVRMDRNYIPASPPPLATVEFVNGKEVDQCCDLCAQEYLLDVAKNNFRVLLTSVEDKVRGILRIVVE